MRTTATSWMSSETSPADAFSNDLPPSVERHTPPISRPAKTRSGSSGSKVMRVTRGLSTAGQVSGSGAFTRSQVFAPSVERKMAGGRVPARIRSGIVRRARDRPDAQIVHRRGQVGPFPARDVEPVDARVRAGQQLARPAGVRGERPHARLRIHAGRAPEALQRLAEVVAVPDGKSRRADVEARRHERSPCIERGDCCLVTAVMPARSADDGHAGGKSRSMRASSQSRRGEGYARMCPLPLWERASQSVQQTRTGEGYPHPFHLR